MHAPPSFTCKHTHRAQCQTFSLFYNVYSAAVQLIGVPLPPVTQIDWYKAVKYIVNSSRVQINKTEIDDSTLVSTLVISSGLI